MAFEHSSAYNYNDSIEGGGETQALLEYARAARAEFERNQELVESVDVMRFLDGATPKQRQEIFQNFGIAMFSDGCNGDCDICMVDANHGIKEQISPDSAEALLDEHQRTPGVSYSQKISLVPYMGSDLLDYPYPFEIARKIEQGAGTPSWDEDRVRARYYTHLPPHAIEPQLKHMSDSIVKMVRSSFFSGEINPNDAPYFVVSVTNNNVDRTSQFRRAVTEIVREKLGNPSGHTMAYVDELLDEHCFAYRNDGSQLVDLGRHYPGDDTPIDDLTIMKSCPEGVMITPNGITSKVFTLPTNDNTTGMLGMPFDQTGKVFKLDKMMMYDEMLDKLSAGEPTEIVMSSLRSSVVSGIEGVPEEILSPRNELLREAFCWYNFMFSDKLMKSQYGQDASLLHEISVIPGALKQFNLRLLEARVILKRTKDSDPRAAAYLKRTLDRIMHTNLA